MESRRAMQGVLAGAVFALACTGCGRTSPIGPGGIGVAPSGEVQATSAPSARGSMSNGVSTLEGFAGEGRSLVCLLGDGSRTQLSLAVWAMPDAVRHCLRNMNGRVHGIVTAPAPPIP